MLTLQCFARRVTCKWLVYICFGGYLRIFGVVFQIRIQSSHKPMTQKISSSVPSVDVSRKVDARKTSETVQKLHTQFRSYGRNTREWMRKCVLMLPAIERERVWEKKDFGSLAEYAARLSGMSKEMVYEGLRVLRAVEGMSDIMRVIEERGIGIVRPILTLLTMENQAFWAEKMRVMSKQTLALYRQEWEREHEARSVMILDSASLHVRTLDINFRPGSEEIAYFPQGKAMEISDTIESSGELLPEKIFKITLRPEVIQQLEKLNGKDGDWNNLMEEFLALRVQKLEQEKPEEKVTESRHIPTSIQRFVIARSRGVCEVGTCAKKYEIWHHTQRFAAEQTHDPDRIIALCTQHERLVHLGLIEDEYIKPREWKIVDEPDKNDKKYLVDRLVQKYRSPR